MIGSEIFNFLASYNYFNNYGVGKMIGCFWECVFFCAMFFSNKETKHQEKEQHLVIRIDQKSDDPEFQQLSPAKIDQKSDDPEFQQLSPAKNFLIRRWRQRVYDESPSVRTLIPVENPEPIDDVYNERVWKWFESNFVRDVRTDFLDSETIYEGPNFFTDQLAQRNRTRKRLQWKN